MPLELEIRCTRRGFLLRCSAVLALGACAPLPPGLLGKGVREEERRSWKVVRRFAEAVLTKDLLPSREDSRRVLDYIRKEERKAPSIRLSMVRSTGSGTEETSDVALAPLRRRAAAVLEDASERAEGRPFHELEGPAAERVLSVLWEGGLALELEEEDAVTLARFYAVYRWLAVEGAFYGPSGKPEGAAAWTRCFGGAPVV